MSVISSKNKAWSSVPMPMEAFTVDDNFQFLCEFEELTDYKVITKKNFDTKKRCLDDESLQSQEETLISTDSGLLKKSDRKRKRSKNVKPEKPVSVSHSKPTTAHLDDQILATTIDDAAEDIGSSSKDEIVLPDWNSIGLSNNLLKALKDLNFVTPTPIQERCILPAVRDHLDILGAAETGSGKTLAFAIPIVQHLLEGSVKNDTKGPKALILTPTRELAIQIKNHINALLKYTTIKVAVVIGGLSIQKQERLLKRCPEILIATPGRLWAMMQEQSSGYLDALVDVKYLVIDETDRMVEKGHFQELASILDRLNSSETDRQTFVFSATLAYVHPTPKRLSAKKDSDQMTPNQKIEMLVSLTRLRKQRKVIDLTRNFGTAEALVETRIICESLEDKDTHLYYFLTKYPGRTLIFANSIDTTRRLKNLLTRLRFSPFVLNAQMHQKQRLKNLEKFADSKTAILLATDVAARGLDIKNIDHVIHYQIPRATEVYVHRSGRTARASKEGLSVMLIDSRDVLNYKKICQNLNRNEELPVFPVDHELLTFLRQSVKLATKLESLEYRTSKISAQKNWIKRAAKEADLDDDDDHNGSNTFDTSSDEMGDSLEVKRQIASFVKSLNASLQKPLPNRSDFSTRYPTSIAEIHEKITSKKPFVELNALEVAKNEQKLPSVKQRLNKIERSSKRKKIM